MWSIVTCGQADVRGVGKLGTIEFARTTACACSSSGMGLLSPHVAVIQIFTPIVCYWAAVLK